MNKGGLDVVHRDLGFGDVETGGGKLYRHNIAESQVVPEDYYMRIGIRGSDAWRPSVITAWCQRFTSGAIVPLGYDEELDVVLSTDPSEGRISLPLRTITPGRIRTEITRVLLVTGTNIRDSATDSPVHVTITRGDGSVVVDHTIPDTSQPDFEGAEGNVYFLPVLQPFTRSQLTDESIVLSIQGDELAAVRGHHVRAEHGGRQPGPDGPPRLLRPVALRRAEHRLRRGQGLGARPALPDRPVGRRCSRARRGGSARGGWVARQHRRGIRPSWPFRPSHEPPPGRRDRR
jgi:hypothetical protein